MPINKLSPLKLYNKTLKLKNVIQKNSYSPGTSNNTPLKKILKLALNSTHNKQNSVPKDPFKCISTEMDQFSHNLYSQLSTEQPLLNKILRHVLESKGKRLRPAINLLISKALSPKSPEHLTKSLTISKSLKFHSIYEKQQRLSEVTELIHTGSLIHDDIIDKSDTRRGKDTLSKSFGNKIAVLGGDYFLACASVSLAKVGSIEAVSLISTSIADLVRGEMIRVKIKSPWNLPEILETYHTKNYFKTASLIANSCRAVAILGQCSPEKVQAAYDYGKNLGLAFQVVDDILDVSDLHVDTGKPKNLDIKSGTITAPSIFLLDEFPKLQNLASRDFFSREEDQVVMREYLTKSKALEKSRNLAKEFAEKARRSLDVFEESEYKTALFDMVQFVVDRER